MSDIKAPSEILDAYYPNGISQENTLTGGIVNTTYLITDTSTHKSILQRLSPIFDERLAEDFDIVSNHLQQEGWEVATALKSFDGKSYVHDTTGNLWRSFSYIESDRATPPAGTDSNIALSGLLGSLHNSLGRLDYKPGFSIPHFHETTHYAEHLEALLPDLTDNKIRNLGAHSIRLSRAQAIPSEPQQLIHGDPKMTNALYRNETPFTFIDFDTLMRANPLIDVGDMLRSITGKMILQDQNFNVNDVDTVIASYYNQAKPQVNEKLFTRQARNAGQVIALEQGIRYLIDSVEDHYFDWNRDKFESRSLHNIARAIAQWQTYETLRS